MINSLYDLGTSIWNFPTNFCSKILRICVFQHPENAGFLEYCLVRIFKFFSQGVCSGGYDNERAKKAKIILGELGAKFVKVPVEGNLIDAMKWDPQILEEKIKTLGGCWQKFTLGDGKEVFAIKPPKIQSQNWKKLEEYFFHFNWPKKEGLIITCPSAENVNEDENLFIQLNSASTSYVMLQKKMGLFIGCKQAVVVFDPPGTGLSTGVASEGSYYSALRAIFEKFAKNYSPDRVWICGTCLGCISAAYMKSKIPNLNLILENGFTNLQEDMVKPEGCFPYWFAKRYGQALLRKDKEESNFNIEKMWSLLSQSHLGKVIVISVDNDQRLSQKVALNLVDLAKRVSSVVKHIHYDSPKKDTHFTRFDDMPGIPEKVLHNIFKPKKY